MRKFWIIPVVSLVFGVSPLMGQERYKSGRVDVPDLGPSAYQLVTFNMTTEKGQMGAPMTLRFKDAQGNILFETDVGKKESPVVRISVSMKLFDVDTTMITVFPELVIGDEVVTLEHPAHFPAGMFESMKKLQKSAVKSSIEIDKN